MVATESADTSGELADALDRDFVVVSVCQI